MGGWYVDEFTIRYRPTGHSDGFILAWINLTGKLVRKLKESGGVFEGLINAKSPGLCGKCHSVDQVVDGSFKVNWHGYRLAEGLKKSVHFSHAVTLLLPFVSPISDWFFFSWSQLWMISAIPKTAPRPI